MSLLSMMTSLNVSEMLGLRRKWVNLTDHPEVAAGEILPPFSLAVRENYYRGKFGWVKANSTCRIVPPSVGVGEALRRVLFASHHTSDEDLVFCSDDALPLNETNLCRRVLKPAVRKLGMRWLSWYVFRHTHATFGERIGMALSDRQAQMGSTLR